MRWNFERTLDDDASARFWQPVDPAVSGQPTPQAGPHMVERHFSHATPQLSSPRVGQRKNSAHLSFGASNPRASRAQLIVSHDVRRPLRLSITREVGTVCCPDCAVGQRAWRRNDHATPHLPLRSVSSHAPAPRPLCSVRQRMGYARVCLAQVRGWVADRLMWPQLRGGLADRAAGPTGRTNWG